jgi:putative DNA primase/helicase
MTDDQAPIFSDEHLALRFARQYAGNLRYVSEIGRWYCWDGTRWQRDRKLLGFNSARKICRAAATECNETQYRVRGLASAKTVAAVEKLARSDHRIAATIDQWDADSWLLNTPNGVIDLRTQKLRAHRPEDHMTKITAAGPDAACPIPIWHKFLARVTNGDADLQAYLQRVLGYALTGETYEHALFFIYGPGANGKSVLLDTALGVMGDYALSAPIETFTVSSTDRHPTELARLHGARLVTATETEEGRRWAESRIKQLTGGDRVPARFMRQDFFEYTPQFKLIVAGNHKPGLRSMDEAIKRRINMILFNVIIPVDQRDKHLTKKLKHEWPGILAWMIKGCAEWKRRGGLDAPKSVTTATEHYFEQEDTLTAWMQDECKIDPTLWASRTELFESWSWWAHKAKEQCGTRSDFLQRLEDRGFEHATRHGSRGFKGLKVQPIRV